MLLGQRLLDPRLALEQPVHGLVEPVLAQGLRQAELRRQGGDRRLRPEEPGGGELRSRLQNPLRDQGDRQIPRARSPGCDRPVDAAGAKRREDRGDVPVLERSGDCERAFERGGHVGDGGAAQNLPDLLDHLRGKLRDVGEGALLDLSAFPVGVADQDRGPRFAVRDGFHEHDYYCIIILLCFKDKNITLY